MKTLLHVSLILLLIAGFAGCTCTGAAPAPEPKPQTAAAAPKPAPTPAPKQGVCGDYAISQNYSTSGAVRLDKRMPQTVQLNAPFEYTIKLTNVTGMTLKDVEVTEIVPASLKNIKSAPAGKLAEGVVTWKIDSLAPKASETITVMATASEPGCLQTCADVTYIVPACAKVNVVQPALALTKSAPSKVVICQAIPIKLVVTNKGSGTASNVVITDELPDGLTTQDGTKTVKLQIGSLAAGQSETRTIMAKASKPGVYENMASATAAGGLIAKSQETSTVVTKPVLTIKKTGPGKEYLGRSIKYDITVTNTGDAVAADTVVTDTIPSGVTGVQATSGGVLAQNKVTWQVGDLAPKQSKKFTVSYKPTNGGTFKNTARATAVCADAVSAAAQTAINAIPAILLEVVDVTDPIEVGSNVTYVITVTNQGSAPGTGIQIKAMLEDTMSYVSSSGATSGSLSGNTVTFDKLASLAPKAKTSWRVVVKAVKPGDVRFKVAMNSDQLGRDVEETEATNFYE